MYQKVEKLHAKVGSASTRTRLIHTDYDLPPPSGRAIVPVSNADVISDDVISHYAEPDDRHFLACIVPHRIFAWPHSNRLEIKQIYDRGCIGVKP
jgi:hypothetical protein